MSSPLRARPVLEPTGAPPYRLSLLGAWDLRGPDGRQIQSVLAQPKRLCLLAYLALQAEPVTRSTLVALFWPDKDEERARNALSQALFYLRRSMGNSVVENVAGDRIRVAPETVWFDAREVLAAYDRGERANEGHTADDLGAFDPDFFRGWNSDDNQPVQEWLDGIRRRLEAIGAEWAASEADRVASPESDAGASHAPLGDRPVDITRSDEAHGPPSVFPRRLLALVGVALLTALVVLASIGVGWWLRGVSVRPLVGDEGRVSPDARIAILQPIVHPTNALPDAMVGAVHANVVHRFIGVSNTPRPVISIPFGHTRMSTRAILEATTETTAPLRVVEIVIQVAPDGLHVTGTLFTGAGSLIAERAVQCIYPVAADGPSASLPGRIADDIIAAFGTDRVVRLEGTPLSDRCS